MLVLICGQSLQNNDISSTHSWHDVFFVMRSLTPPASSVLSSRVPTGISSPGRTPQSYHPRTSSPIRQHRGMLREQRLVLWSSHTPCFFWHTSQPAHFSIPLHGVPSKHVFLSPLACLMIRGNERMRVLSTLSVNIPIAQYDLEFATVFLQPHEHLFSSVPLYPLVHSEQYTSNTPSQS